MKISDLTNRTTKAERATNRNEGTEEHNGSDTTLVDVGLVLLQKQPSFQVSLVFRHRHL